MRAKILIGAAAFALATTAGLGTTTPAFAHDAKWNPGYVAADIVGGVIGGALAAATSPFRATDGYYPGYAYMPGYVYEPGYTYMPGYSYAYPPGYSYRYPAYSYGYYGSYLGRHWHYRGGPHAR
jgi:hypothetical protein